MHFIASTRELSPPVYDNKYMWVPILKMESFEINYTFLKYFSHLTNYRDLGILWAKFQVFHHISASLLAHCIIYHTKDLVNPVFPFQFDEFFKNEMKKYRLNENPPSRITLMIGSSSASSPFEKELVWRCSFCAERLCESETLSTSEDFQFISGCKNICQ